MTVGILITQCLQRDFVAPIGPYQPLPSTLHVGWQEARRLLGETPDHGPLAQLLGWARAQLPADLQIIHVRDWHSESDPAQRQHLTAFGPHCLEGSRGAELVLGNVQVGQRSNEHFVNSTSLNDFEGGTHLGDLLHSIRAVDGAEPVRVGVIGVWTEAKVTFLLYELLTRCGISQLATCSALTASASRSQHFVALQQLRRILGVQVFDSIGEFTSWLVPSGVRLEQLAQADGQQTIPILPDESLLLCEDRSVVSYLYRDSAELELQPLPGGFSEAKVFRVRSKDALGHAQASSVLKLGPRELIARERVAFEEVEQILGNDAPTVRGFVDMGDRAGIKFAYAAMGSGGVRSFQDLYGSGLDQSRVDKLLGIVFEELLGRFYSAAHYEKLNLLDYYTFSPSHATAVRESIVPLMDGVERRSGRLTFPGGYRVGDVAEFYAQGLEEWCATDSEFHYVSYVHGDLNAANILVDERDNVWLIDFYQTHRGHLLRDLAKLENDLLYILTPIGSAEELAEALQISQALRCVKDLRAPLPESLPGIQRPQLLRAWRTVQTLRRLVAGACREERDPAHLELALLRYAAHTLKFDESNVWQKRWALAAAGGYADDLLRNVRENRELRIDWLPAAAGEGRLGLTICPGRRDRGRDLNADLNSLRVAGAGRLVSLLTEDELDFAGVKDLTLRATQAGFQALHEPIPDQSIPTIRQMREIAEWVEQGLGRGTPVVLHCLGGLGRSGTVAACLLVRRGFAPQAAIDAVRDARGPRAIESSIQERFVLEYAGAFAASS